MTKHTYAARPTRWYIDRSDGDQDARIVVDIEDEGDGEFVELSQSSSMYVVAIEPENWPAVRDAIERAMAVIAEHEAARK